MFDVIKPLLDSGIINEDTRQAISEAWEAKLSEAREAVRAELREEFARRYEHDKGVIVEALDKMVTESLAAELAEFAEDKRRLAEDRVQFKAHMKESSNKFNSFMVSKLSEEIQELRNDRRNTSEAVAKLQSFVARTLAEEIREFAQDKQAVVETKVRLIANANAKLDELKEKFVARSAKLVKESITKNLDAELTQLKEDIQTARENMFGRRLFEAFASEFAVTHLNENREIHKLQTIISQKDQQLQEATQVAEKHSKLVESKEREIKVIRESAERRDTLNELLKPLNREKATVMRELLESVQTEKLRTAFDKYLPAVLNDSKVSPKSEKTVLAESRSVVTGDKAAKTDVAHEGENIIEIKRLAGLK
jgi:predicted DNA-binding protein